MTSLTAYPWASMTAQRSTADYAWQYTINLHGSTLLPTMFQRLEYQPDSLHCAMLGEPVEPTIENDYPGSSATITGYSYGYYFRNPVSYKYRQSLAGVDIPTWERAGSNYEGETTRADEIKSYENPSYHLKKLLWPLDVNGTPTKAWGYCNLYLGRVDPVPNWGLGTSAAVKLSSTLGSAVKILYLDDVSVFPDPGTASYVKIFTYTDEDDDAVYDEGEEITDYEVCRYTAKTVTTGIKGYLTLDARTKVKTWNASSAVAVYLDDGYDVKHPSIEKKQFFFDGGNSIGDVLDKYAEHCSMISFTKFVKVSGTWREYFYWIPKYRLEETDGNYLNLPTTIMAVTPATSNLIGSPGLSASIGFEDSFNAIWVEALRSKDSAWFYGYAEDPLVTAGTEVARVLLFRTDSLLPDCAGNTWSETLTDDTYYGPVTDGGASYGTEAENTECQRLTDEKASELLKYSGYTIQTYTCSFKNTYFELYQRLQFTGFTGIPTDVMRVTEIQYEFNPPDAGGMVCTITCAKATTLQESGKFQSIVDEIQANYEKLKESVSDSSDTQKMGVVIATYQDGSMATVQLRSTGTIIKRRSYGLRTASA